MTAVAASPPSFPRSNWTNGASSMHAQMTPDDVSRLLMPPRSKALSTASSSPSSAASSLSAASSTSTATSTASSLLASSQKLSSLHHHQQQQNLHSHQLPPRPSSSASNSSSISSISSASMPGSATSTSTPASSNPSPNNSEPSTPINSAANTVANGPSWGGNGKRNKAARNGVGSRESSMKNSGNASTALNAAIGNGGAGSFLMLLPLNGTFERKVIPLPFYPEILRIGRQTNAKTIPTQSNGFFDSKVLSRQHAEVWAEKGTGRVYIRDVKSSNGTFVNGTRLSPENRDSEPHEIRAEDILELGIDIVGEDNKTIVHHKVAARVQHAGFHQTQNVTGNAGNFDLNFGDIDPSVGGGLMAPPLNHVQTVTSVTSGRGRSNSQTSRGGPMAFLPNGLVGIQRQGNQLMAGMPITIEAIAKRLNYEMQQARHQQAELKKAHDFFDVVLMQPKVVETTEQPLVNGGATQPKPSNVGESTEVNEPVDNAELPVPIEQIEVWTQTRFPGKPPSQILSLVAVLADTKRDLEAKSQRVKELEDNLKKERVARELAEGRIEVLELATLASKTVQNSETEVAKAPVAEDLEELVPDVFDLGEGLDKALTPEPAVVDNDMQLKLDKFMADLTAAQAEIESLKQSLQRSETEKSSVQNAISQLVEDKKNESEARITAEKALEKAHAREQKEKEARKELNGVSTPAKGGNKGQQTDKVENGGASTGLAAKNRSLVMQPQRHFGAPFASFFGVVVVGVTVMVVLNSWTKGEKP